MGKKTFAVSLDSVVYDRLLDFGCDLKLSSLSEMVNTALKRYFSAREEGKRFCHAALFELDAQQCRQRFTASDSLTQRKNI